MTTDAGERFHFIGICGRAMSAVALALARAGHEVTGSDEGTYGSARQELEEAGIVVSPGYGRHPLPDDTCLVVGKRVTTDNPELSFALESGLRVTSFPRLLHDRFLRRSRNAVIAGGVGKTTTAAMLAWILEDAGLRPDFLIGGRARNLPVSARFDGSSVTVLEGDEYASCFDDPRPKFLHYAPEVVVVTNLLEDHPDLYPTFRDLADAFGTLVRLVPSHGLLVVPDDDARQLTSSARCRTVAVGTTQTADCRLLVKHLTPNGSSFDLDGTPFDVPVFGVMNIRNAAMAARAALVFDVPLWRSAQALSKFTGVEHRQQGGSAGLCTLVVDKATHPQSLSALADALRQQYPGRRVVAVVEPRATGGRRWVYQRDLPAALAGFDKVILTSAYEHNPPRHTAWEREPFSIDDLTQALATRGVDVTRVPRLVDVPPVVCDAVLPGDVVLLSLREQHTAHVTAIETALQHHGRTPDGRPSAVAPSGIRDDAPQPRQ